MMCASLLSLWKHVVLIESIIFCMDPIGRDAPSRMTEKPRSHSLLTTNQRRA